MTTHLPECWATDPSDPPAWCICDELRACEERMLTTYLARDNFEAGLDAAREAVEALRGWLGTDDSGDGTVWLEKIVALAAIKGEQT
jgi:hypothetical protein